jgi:hypothetical protein
MLAVGFYRRVTDKLMPSEAQGTVSDSRTNDTGSATTNITMDIRLEDLTAVSMKMAVFWVVAPCRLVQVYQRFRG